MDQDGDKLLISVKKKYPWNTRPAVSLERSERSKISGEKPLVSAKRRFRTCEKTPSPFQRKPQIPSAKLQGNPKLWTPILQLILRASVSESRSSLGYLLHKLKHTTSLRGVLQRRTTWFRSTRIRALMNQCGTISRCWMLRFDPNIPLNCCTKNWGFVYTMSSTMAQWTKNDMLHLSER